MRYLLEVRLTAGDVGSRVVIRWRRPAGSDGEEIADVVGVLGAADAVSFTIRKASGELVTIPRNLALAGKTVPAVPRRRRVPVTSGQRLAGIVSRGDVVALLTTEWVCQVCGEAARGQHPPARCPKCHAGSDRFILQDACPGD